MVLSDNPTPWDFSRLAYLGLEVGVLVQRIRWVGGCRLWVRMEVRIDWPSLPVGLVIARDMMVGGIGIGGWVVLCCWEWCSIKVGLESWLLILSCDA